MQYTDDTLKDCKHHDVAFALQKQVENCKIISEKLNPTLLNLIQKKTDIIVFSLNNSRKNEVKYLITLYDNLIDYKNHV